MSAFEVPKKLTLKQGFKCREFIWEVIQEMLGGGWRTEKQKGRKSMKSILVFKFPLWAVGAPSHGDLCGSMWNIHLQASHRRGEGAGVHTQPPLSAAEMQSSAQTSPAPSTCISSFSKSPFCWGLDLFIRHHKYRTSRLQPVRTSGGKRIHTHGLLNKAAATKIQISQHVKFSIHNHFIST